MSKYVFILTVSYIFSKIYFINKLTFNLFKADVLTIWKPASQFLLGLRQIASILLEHYP